MSIFILFLLYNLINVNLSTLEKSFSKVSYNNINNLYETIEEFKLMDDYQLFVIVTYFVNL